MVRCTDRTYDPQRYSCGPVIRNTQKSDIQFGKWPFLDYQTSFTYGSTYKDSKGREAWVNNIKHPVKPPVEESPNDESSKLIKEWWEAKWKQSNTNKPTKCKPPILEHTETFSEWCSKKVAQDMEAQMRRAQLLELELENAKKSKREAQKAFRKWKRAKRKQSREILKEAKREKQRERRLRAEKERRNREAFERYLRNKQEERLKALDVKKLEEITQEQKRIREQDDEKQKETESAFELWCRKKEQELHVERKRKLRNEKVKQELLQRERKEKWKRKTVVLAYSSKS